MATMMNYELHRRFRYICIPVVGAMLRSVFYPWEAP